MPIDVTVLETPHQPHKRGDRVKRALVPIEQLPHLERAPPVIRLSRRRAPEPVLVPVARVRRGRAARWSHPSARNRRITKRFALCGGEGRLRAAHPLNPVLTKICPTARTDFSFVLCMGGAPMTEIRASAAAACRTLLSTASHLVVRAAHGFRFRWGRREEGSAVCLLVVRSGLATARPAVTLGLVGATLLASSASLIGMTYLNRDPILSVRKTWPSPLLALSLRMDPAHQTPSLRPRSPRGSSSTCRRMCRIRTGR